MKFKVETRAECNSSLGKNINKKVFWLIHIDYEYSLMVW